MSAHTSVVLLAGVGCIFVGLCQAQTLTYASGWTNGKRSLLTPTLSDLVAGPAAGHHGHSDPVTITDTQLGRNYLCFEVNSQLTDTLINFVLKSNPRSMQRGQGE